MRQETLIDESLTPVDIGPRCSLSGGGWYSHFDGRALIDPSQLDAD